MKIAVCGGDKRMLFAAKALADDGHEVQLAGFDHLYSLCEIAVTSVKEATKNCEIAILPVVPAIDGVLNAPFTERRIPIDLLMEQIGKKPVFTGRASSIKPYASGAVLDYSVEESFLLRNAELTAEAALGYLIRDYEGAIQGAKVLVTGYGRIGKILSAYLKTMGAIVTAAARNPADRALIDKNGMTAVNYPEVDWARYQVIINTVPALVIDKSAVDMMRDDVFVIDLASLPGGVDFTRTQERDLTCIHALSLPGKTAPLTAGTIIKDSVMKLLSQKIL